MELLQHGRDDHAKLAEEFLGSGRHAGRVGHWEQVEEIDGTISQLEEAEWIVRVMEAVEG